ncbi:MAG: hypothetical protein KUG75_11180 [Pseudomonadales bacterium]|nr:hypothetical protein [Pseudomonadales bacterium]
MQKAEIESLFEPVLTKIFEDCQVTDSFIDREMYQINIATVWTNVVLKPDSIGLSENDLETVHNIFDEYAKIALGEENSLKGCFRFINAKAGEQAMKRCKVNQNHKDMLLYFCSMILDPEGHERWMEENTEPK